MVRQPCRVWPLSGVRKRLLSFGCVKPQIFIWRNCGPTRDLPTLELFILRRPGLSLTPPGLGFSLGLGLCIDADGS